MSEKVHLSNLNYLQKDQSSDFQQCYCMVLGSDGFAEIFLRRKSAGRRLPLQRARVERNAVLTVFHFRVPRLPICEAVCHER